MSNGWITRKTTDIERYDAVNSLLRILNKLTVKVAEEVREEFEKQNYNDYYCADCESTREDCYCQVDDYPYYDNYDRDDDDTSSKPSEKEKV